MFKHKYSHGSLIGVFFIPIYGALNIIAYFSQVTFIPNLLLLEAETDHFEAVHFALHQFSQLAPGSFKIKSEQYVKNQFSDPIDYLMAT